MCPDELLNALPRFTPEKALSEMNGVTLAFVGDAVYELLVRDRVLSACSGRVNALHEKTVAFSNAAFQSAAAKRLLPLLTEDEAAVFMRGRNAHTAHTPKNKTRAEYHLATALEAVFGYLYIVRRTDRICALFQKITEFYEERDVQNEETAT